jgi:hypothetical protein
VLQVLDLAQLLDPFAAARRVYLLPERSDTRRQGFELLLQSAMQALLVHIVSPNRPFRRSDGQHARAAKRCRDGAALDVAD